MADIVVGINMHSITDFDIAEHKSIYLTINDSQSLHNYLQCRTAPKPYILNYYTSGILTVEHRVK